MDRNDVIKYSLSLANTFQDYPFEDDATSCVIKHSENKKWFVLLMKVNGEDYLNVKTDPFYSELLRKSYEYIIPGYHMNKQHWNTIILGKNVDPEIVKDLINQSYDLTKNIKNGRKYEKFR